MVICVRRPGHLSCRPPHPIRARRYRRLDRSHACPIDFSKVLVAQGGGPTAVINQSLVGAVLESRKFREVERVYGAFHGVRGIVNEDFVDLTQETTHNLEMVANTPSSALGSTRDKPDLKYCQEIFKVLRAHGVGCFFYIGGNDSSDTVRIVSEEARNAGYPLRAIHIPKTIDNDLMVNDHTPGFPSAARWVAQAFAGANLDNWALPGVYIAVVMGRHAGFLTAASALGKKFPDDGPHLIYVPGARLRHRQVPRRREGDHGQIRPLRRRRLRRRSATRTMCRSPKSSPSRSRRDDHGNVHLGGGALADELTELVKNKLGFKRVRADTFGYVQRSFVGCVSDVDQREAREVGEKAVQYALWGDRDGSVTIHRTGFYSVDYQLTPLEQIAGENKGDAGRIHRPCGTDVTDAFRMYLRPLLGSGMPDAYRLRLNRVPKILT